MSNILIGAQRKEIAKLFELLLWQTGRTFKHVSTLEKIICQAKTSSPYLLIIDISIDTPEHCLNALTELKENQTTADIPIILVTDPTRDCEENSKLLLASDAQFQEPFKPAEIKTVIGQFM